MGDLVLPPLIYSLHPYQYQCGLTTVYCIPWGLIQHCFSYFTPPTVVAPAAGSSFVQAITHLWGLLRVLLAPVLGLVISPSSPGPFYWRKVLETKIQAAGMLTATGMSSPLGPLAEIADHPYVMLEDREVPRDFHHFLGTLKPPTGSLPWSLSRSVFCAVQ